MPASVSIVELKADIKPSCEVIFDATFSLLLTYSASWCSLMQEMASPRRDASSGVEGVEPLIQLLAQLPLCLNVVEGFSVAVCRFLAAFPWALPLLRLSSSLNQTAMHHWSYVRA